MDVWLSCRTGGAYAAAGLAWLLATTTVTAAAFDPVEFWREPTNVAFDVSILTQGQDADISWQGMVYTSEMYNGQPMRIFAWYAWPKTEGKHPAVVSVHGGGGGADLPRAQAFARAGYGCLAYDWNGWRDPVVQWKPGDPLPAVANTVYCGLNYDGWVEHFCYPGPDGDWKWPEQYRAVTAARRAVTWMSQRPEVDADKIVAEGHSWGGMLTQILASMEPRLKAIAVSASAGAWASRYKSGQEGHTKGLTPAQAEQYFERYDPASFADRIGAPILLRLGTDDFFASVDNLMDYWDRIKAPKSLELLPAGNHTFSDVETRVAWFNHWLNKGPGFPRIESVTAVPAKHGEWSVTVKAAGTAAIQKAVVAWSTSANIVWNKRPWVARPLTQRPDGAWTGVFTPVAVGGPLRLFVSVQDANGRVASSLPVLKDMPASTPPAVVPILYADLRAAQATQSPIKAPEEWKHMVGEAGPVGYGAEVVAEQSFRIGILWDADNLYVRIPVRDATPWMAPAPETPPQDGDGVEISLATAASGDLPPANTLHVRWTPEANGTVRAEILKDNSPGAAEIPEADLVRSIAVEPGAGYTLAVGIPWSLLAPDFKPGKGVSAVFGVTVSYGDYLTRERVAAIEMNHYDAADKSSRRKTVVLE